MRSVVLYAAPGSCTRVPAICLEEIGLDFDYRLVRFMKGEHKSAEYKVYNPKGKVPTLLIDGEALTENVAIISYLHARYPEQGLMPVAQNALASARQLADLCFCASTLHPLVTRPRVPQFLAAPDALASVWEKAAAAMAEYFSLIEGRLAHEAWWYGQAWSAMDAYLYWVYWRVAGAEFDVSPYPAFTHHRQRMESRESTQRALAREVAANQQLESEGLAFSPPPRPR